MVAERQGEVAAANMVGMTRRFDSAPFFWTDQYGTVIRYVGHASRWDEVIVDGDIDGGSFTIRYFSDGLHRASASVGRDRDNLEDELVLESQVSPAL